MVINILHPVTEKTNQNLIPVKRGNNIKKNLNDFFISILIFIYEYHGIHIRYYSRQLTIFFK
jgi:hypothetical protein